MLSSDDAATLRVIGHNFIRLFVTVVFKTYLLGMFQFPHRSLDPNADALLCSHLFATRRVDRFPTSVRITTVHNVHDSTF